MNLTSETNPIRAVVRGGVIVPQHPLSWPEGTEVEVTPSEFASNSVLHGMTEEEQGNTPEQIDRWLAEMASIPTPIWSDRDQSLWEQRRAEDRAWELANAEIRERKLSEGWE